MLVSVVNTDAPDCDKAWDPWRCTQSVALTKALVMFLGFTDLGDHVDDLYSHMMACWGLWSILLLRVMSGSHVDMNGLWDHVGICGPGCLWGCCLCPWSCCNQEPYLWSVLSPETLWSPLSVLPLTEIARKLLLPWHRWLQTHSWERGTWKASATTLTSPHTSKSNSLNGKLWILFNTLKECDIDAEV